MTKRATIKDIANALNISTSTVSRALTGQWDVNPETRKKVLEIAEKLNYHPNSISLNLKNQRSNIIGIIVPEIISFYFGEILIGIEKVLYENGYNFLIAQSNESFESEKKHIDLLEKYMVDGFLISVAKDSPDADFYQNIIDKGIPIVFFNRVPEEINASRVIIDDRNWAFKATEHLIQQGCTRIAHLSGNENLFMSNERKLGYIAALKAYKLPVREELIIEAGVLIEDGIKGAQKLMQLDPLPDGLFVMTDPLAIGAMQTFKKNGIKVPEDIAVVGFTESPMSDIIDPNLTSVKQPTFEIGETAANLLIQHISDAKKAPQTIILDAELHIKESSLREKYR